MKRKIVKQGEATLTVSIPAKWASKFTLKPGDEVDLREQDKTLIISASSNDGPKKELIDLSTITYLSKRIVAAKYLKGCSEIDIRIGSHSQAKGIRDRVRSMQGFEIVQQTKNSVIVKEVTGSSVIELVPLMRRIFSMVNTVGQESLISLRAKETDLSYLEDLEQSINRFTDLCFRAINLQGADSYIKMTSLYTICFLLEAIADKMKDLLIFIRTCKVVLPSDIIDLYEDLLKMIKMLEEVIYSFSYEKADKMARAYENILASIQSKITKRKAEHVVVLMHIRSIAEFTIWAMNQQLINT